MKSAFWRTMAVLAVVAMPTMAAANDATIGSEAAHSSMVGTTLNNTTALFNAWPHLVTQNGTGAEIVSQNLMGMGDDGGRARVWWEAYDELWLNLQVGRTDLGSQAANFLWGGNRMSDFLAVDQFNNPDTDQNPLRNPWINVGIAKPTGNGGAWAANLIFAAENSKDDAADPTTDFGGSAFGGLFSWGNGQGLNVSAEFTTQSDDLDTGDAATTTEASFNNFSLNGRYDTDLYIYQGSFVFGSGTYTEEVAGESVDTDVSAMGFLASAGRFIKNEVDGQTSVEFTFSYLNQKLEQGDAEDSTTDMVIPGVKVAAWEKISDRFGLMGGVSSAYTLSSRTVDPDATTDTSDNGFGYDWQAGIFTQFTDNVRVDFQLVKDNLGKVLSLGNDDALVYYIGATVGLN